MYYVTSWNEHFKFTLDLNTWTKYKGQTRLLGEYLIEWKKNYYYEHNKRDIENYYKSQISSKFWDNNF